MLNCLLDLYQICLNHVSGAKIGHVQRVISIEYQIFENLHPETVILLLILLNSRPTAKVLR